MSDSNADWVVLLMPLVGFVLLAFGSFLPRRAVSVIGPGSVAIAFAGALAMFAYVSGLVGTAKVHDTVGYTWIVSGTFRVDFGLFVDPLSCVMTLIVTGVGFLILVYSVGYMAEDSDYRRFFCYMNLFIFTMLLLVLSDNYLFLLIGWAGVGLTSFLLIGFWYERPSAVTAARQALVVNVIGDWGMMVAAFILFRYFHTLQYNSVFTRAHSVLPFDGSTVRLITLFLLVAAVAKSAQLPLHVWLPNAMEGPTPVSALIHAATMVTAGVYLIARSYPLFHSAPFTQNVVIIVGTASAFVAATIALANNDIKRVLAYSTMSQIAYMFVAVGSASYVAGIFHLTTHAYFKACLFMGAGAVMHALHDNVDIRKMGGLRTKMPFTFWTFFIAALAIAGVPLLSAFFSKDEIIGAIYAHASGAGWLWIVWIFLVITSGLTALYMFRLLFIVFFGESRDPAAGRSRSRPTDGHEDSDGDTGRAVYRRRIPLGSRRHRLHRQLAVANVRPVPAPCTARAAGSMGVTGHHDGSSWPGHLCGVSGLLPTAACAPTILGNGALALSVPSQPMVHRRSIRCSDRPTIYPIRAVS